MSPGPAMPPAPTVSPGPAVSPIPTISPGPTVSPDPQYPTPDRMDIGLVPTATAPTPNAPSSAPNATPGTTLSPPSDLGTAVTDGAGIDQSTSDSPLPDPRPPSPHIGLGQPLPDFLAIQAESPADLGEIAGAVAVRDTFDIKGVHGDFITKATVQYWEDILGGEKWIKMVQGYLDLERMPLASGVCNLSYIFQSP